MKKIKETLEYFKTLVLATDELKKHPHHIKTIFADDCKMIRKFKGNPDHIHFWSRSLKTCVTFEFLNGKMKCLSNN